VDAKQLIAETAADVVHVCTPPETHVMLVECALDAGLHAIVEKPLAPSAAETEMILETANARGCVVCPVHQTAFQPWLAQVAQTGELLTLEYSACSAGAERMQPREMDRVVDEILPHPLSLFERLCPKALEGSAWNVLRPKPGELRVQGEAAGVSLALSISMNGRPPRHELRVTGTRGTLVADLFHGYAWREGAAASRTYKTLRPFAVAFWSSLGAGRNLLRRVGMWEPAYPGLRDLIRAVYLQIEGAGTVALDGEHILRVARARDQMRRGA
jgi:predicted dehydrogenase